MSTRSTIAYREHTGIIKKIYCHHDGYLSHNGYILQVYYSTPERVKALVDMGNTSEIAEQLDGCLPYAPAEGLHYTDIKQMEEYNYLYDIEKCVWYVRYDISGWMLLTNALKGEMKAGPEYYLQYGDLADVWMRIIEAAYKAKYCIK